MESKLLQRLADKSMTKAELLRKVEADFAILPDLLEGVSSPKASIRYGCANVLVDLSARHPEELYPHMHVFVDLLDSKHRILVWSAMAMIANMAAVDKEKKFEAVFDKYYGFLNDEYMVTVANVVGNSGKIASAKPHLVQKITGRLLKVEGISATPHLTEECKRVICEKAIKSFDQFFDKIDSREKVIAFVKRQRDSPRKTLKAEAERFLAKWNPV
jgi:hypothetical protein